VAARVARPVNPRDSPGPHPRLKPTGAWAPVPVNWMSRRWPAGTGPTRLPLAVTVARPLRRPVPAGVWHLAPEAGTELACRSGRRSPAAGPAQSSSGSPSCPITGGPRKEASATGRTRRSNGPAGRG
jgi:hypothetical protein